MEKVLFKEEQRFTQWWMWLLLGCAFLIPMLFILLELVNSDDKAEAFFLLFIITSVGLVFGWFLMRMKLNVEITQEEIRFRFAPVLSKWRNIKREDINRFEVRTYRAIAEYGGWGIKGSRKNKAYNVRGNIGLQLYLNDGKKLLLGTQKKQAINFAMRKLMGEGKIILPRQRKSSKTVAHGNNRLKKFLIILAIEIVLAIVIFSLIQVFK